MNQVISRLFSPPPPKSTICIIIKPLGNSQYKVRDDAGREFVVSSSLVWAVHDSVKVAQDRIVDKATKPKTIKVYNV